MSVVNSNSEFKYASAAVYGSLAYDFSNTAAMPDYVPEYEPVPAPIPKTQAPKIPEINENEDTRVHLNSRVKTAWRVSPLAMIGFALAGVLLVLVLFSYIALTKLSDSTVQLKDEINDLQLEQTKLLVNHESVFDLNEIEEYATGVLGMVKADSSQIKYIDTGGSDKAVILNGETNEIKKTYNSVKEFFDLIKESLS